MGLERVLKPILKRVLDSDWVAPENGMETGLWNGNVWNCRQFNWIVLFASDFIFPRNGTFGMKLFYPWGCSRGEIRNSFNFCLQSGSDESGCRDSCRFLWQVNSIRPGTCPPETQATGTAALCIKGCDSDADCSSVGLKCCSNGCGWTCQVPSHAHDGEFKFMPWNGSCQI